MNGLKLSYKFMHLPKNILFIKKRGIPEISSRMFDVILYLQEKYNIYAFIEPEVYKEEENRILALNKVAPSHQFSSNIRHRKKRINVLTGTMKRSIDTCLLMGGDGTLLHLNYLYQNGLKVPPVVAFSYGTLGFLIPFSEIEKVAGSLLEGIKKFHIGHRMLLQCKINDSVDGTNEHLYDFLNEMAIEKGEWMLPAPMEIFIDGNLLTTTKADGLIISTPTGSTAYNLSAGGSIASPSASVIMITPICPHTLSFRPLIVPHTSEIRVRIPSHSKIKGMLVTLDGQKRWQMFPRHEIIVKKSLKTFQIVKTVGNDNDWYEAIRRKLHWNENKF